MEGLDWDNPSAASTLLSAIGLPLSIWNFTAHDNPHDFPTVSGCVIGDYHPDDITNNSLENTMEHQSVASDSKFFYNLGMNSAIDNRYQQGELRITPEIYCFKSPSIMQEQAFDHKLPVSTDPLTYFLSSANSTTNATADDAVISSQIHIVTDREHSIISSNKSFRTLTCGRAISSESADQDEKVSQSSSHPLSKKRKSLGTTDCSSLEGENYLFFNGYQSDFSPKGGGFKLTTEDYSTKQKKASLEKLEKSSSIKFLGPNSPFLEPDTEAIATMKEMIYRAAALRPVNLGPEIIEKSNRKNVKISSDPQTVAARQRRERISDRIRILQRLVPGGTKMDTATMLDEAASYLKFLKSHVALLQSLGGTANNSMNYQQNQ